MKIPEWLRPAFNFGKQLIKKFNDDNSAIVAAAISFFIFMSLVPLLLLAVASLGFFFRSEQHAYDFVTNLVRSYSPAIADESGPGIRFILEDIIRGSGAATGIGIIFLFWSGSQAFMNLEKIINLSWNTTPRGYLKSGLVSILLLIAVGVLLLLSFLITTAANALLAHNITIFGRNLNEAFGIAWRFLSLLLPLALSIGTFTMIYKIMPNTRVPLRTAFVGGLVAGLLWEAAKQVFSWYVTNFANYSAVYGSLASLILLLLWIYYSSIITLLGAHLSSIYHRSRPAQG
ncbi:MAG: YihY/virulence factor BrkB family protein [Armatimonadota bacterium]